MNHLTRPAGLDPKAICLVLQAVVAAILTIELDQSLIQMTDDDFLDAEGLMQLEAARVFRSGLFDSLSLGLVLVFLTMPLLMLSHLHLFVRCAQDELRATTASPLHGSLACFPAYFLTRLLEWFALFGFGWLGLRINVLLLSHLENEISWPPLLLAFFVNSLGLIGLLTLLMIADSTRLHAVLVSAPGLRLRARLKRALVTVWDNFGLLLLGRFFRLCFVLVVSTALWLLHRTSQVNWWLLAIISQISIYMTLILEAWWYRILCSRAFRSLEINSHSTR